MPSKISNLDGHIDVKKLAGLIRGPVQAQEASGDKDYTIRVVDNQICLEIKHEGEAPYLLPINRETLEEMKSVRETFRKEHANCKVLPKMSKKSDDKFDRVCDKLEALLSSGQFA